MDRQAFLLGRIRLVLGLFIIGLVVSGLTAFPLEWELNTLARWMGAPDNATVDSTTGLLQWIVRVRNGLTDTYSRYPWLAYGTDWLAFGHLMIAVAFIGALRDPRRNIWVVEFGIIACAMVVPAALICGPIRGIPVYWRLIDCSFGVFGIVPLWLVRRYILQLDAKTFG
ncbi:MAG: hypothetical protein Q7T82_14875 [Armatimonadota bacterium]|nr:hypothetical protein [Armatimonadota bacterium]